MNASSPIHGYSMSFKWFTPMSHHLFIMNFDYGHQMSVSCIDYDSLRWRLVVTVRTETYMWRRTVDTHSKDTLYPLPICSLPQHIGSGSVHYKIQIVITIAWAIIEVSGHQHWWLAGGYDLEIRHF